MDKIPVAVLGATGAVGQRFVQQLTDHPWFEISAVTGSKRTTGGKFGEVCRWVLDGDPPKALKSMTVSSTIPNLPARIVFSALPSHIARQTEPSFAEAGYIVCSNASAYRQEPDVPLIIPEINPSHLALIKHQRAHRGWDGLIVTSPNCTTTGLAMTLKPLDIAFGVQQILVTTMQAVSGAGYPGVPYLDIVDNIIPYIPGEEEKIQQETRILLGHIERGDRRPAEFTVSAQANRVPIIDGHTLSLAVKFERIPTVDEAIQTFESFVSPIKEFGLPSAPETPIIYQSQPDRPQPRRDRAISAGMSVTVGRLLPCPILDLRLVSIVHNTLRGAASGSILNAELLIAKGYI
ncbi:MAG: aspartate-semialdehyde dehydrogenase [Anaerolineales bacterium]|jgi:aspartate-semialdehyde dehydrogenase